MISIPPIGRSSEGEGSHSGLLSPKVNSNALLDYITNKHAMWNVSLNDVSMNVSVIFFVFDLSSLSLIYAKVIPYHRMGNEVMMMTTICISTCHGMSNKSCLPHPGSTQSFIPLIGIKWTWITNTVVHNT